MSERKEIKISIFDKERWEGDWPSEEPGAFFTWFEQKLASIPAEFRGSARIELETINGYEGSSDPKIEISYTRPETDDELAARTERERARKVWEEKRERAVLAELMKKYQS